MTNPIDAPVDSGPAAAPTAPAQPTEPLDGELRAAVARVARVPVLLVACDYDGTLAPIVADPTKAVPLSEAVAAVRALASLPQTTVAVISGRALRDLAALSRLPSEVHLVGSHGSEFDVGFVDALAPEAQQLRTELVETLSALVRRRPGVRLEVKPASVAVHTRAAAPDVAAVVLEAIRTGPATWPGINVTHGKEVVELSVIATHKGMAVDALRTQISASAVVFIGDDVTDENAFAHLHGPDIGIKIGPGETKAGYRVAEPLDAVRVLATLLETRRNWLYGERAVPIERHSMLSNRRTIALLAPDAKVTWLCHPSPDSAAIFADLVGGSPAGHFSVRPAVRDGMPLGQRRGGRGEDRAGRLVAQAAQGQRGAQYVVPGDAGQLERASPVPPALLDPGLADLDRVVPGAQAVGTGAQLQDALPAHRGEVDLGPDGLVPAVVGDVPLHAGGVQRHRLVGAQHEYAVAERLEPDGHLPVLGAGGELDPGPDGAGQYPDQRGRLRRGDRVVQRYVAVQPVRHGQPGPAGLHGHRPGPVPLAQGHALALRRPDREVPGR